MGEKLKGKDLVLLLDKNEQMVPACCSRDLTIDVTAETIEATKVPSSHWRSYIYGMAGYTLSSNNLVVIGDAITVNDIFQAIAQRKTFSFVARHEEEAEVFFSGKVLITNLSIVGANKDVMQYSFTATGDGPLSNTNPYEINILTDGNGNPLEDGEGNMIYEQVTGDLLPINLTINC